MKTSILKWLFFFPFYWLISFITFLIISFLMNWFSSFNEVFYWLTVPWVYFIGGVCFPIAIIILVMDELNLPHKSASLVLFITNFIISIWALKNGKYTFQSEVDILGVIYSSMSLFGIIPLFFYKESKEKGFKAENVKTN